MKMPKEVDVLEADDMCIGPLQDGCKWCMAGWVDVVFNQTNGWDVIDDTLEKAAIQLGSRYPTNMSDADTVSPALAARTWNLAMAYLGYVVDNPMAKYVK